MYDVYISFRDRINNKLIRFFLRHCNLQSLTLRQCMQKVEWQECAVIAEEMRKGRSV